jgi:hypothetical protein
MNKKQHSKLRMYRSVRDVLLAGGAAGVQLPAYATLQQQLDEAIGQIDSTLLMQRTVITGHRVQGDSLFNELLENGLRIAGGLRLVARANGDAVLRKKATVTSSGVRRLRREDRVALLESLLVLAREHAVALQPLGISAADADNLEAGLQVYQQLLLAPRAAILKRKEATAQLDALYRNTDALLKDELDALMLTLSATQPDLFRSYVNARNLVDLPRRKRSEPETGEA